MGQWEKMLITVMRPIGYVRCIIVSWAIKFFIGGYKIIYFLKFHFQRGFLNILSKLNFANSKSIQEINKTPFASFILEIKGKFLKPHNPPDSNMYAQKRQLIYLPILPSM